MHVVQRMHKKLHYHTDVAYNQNKEIGEIEYFKKSVNIHNTNLYNFQCNYCDKILIIKFIWWYIALISLNKISNSRCRKSVWNVI